MCQIMKRAREYGEHFFVNGDIAVLSLGTGSPKRMNKYNTKVASTWGLEWLYSNGTLPLVESFTKSSMAAIENYAPFIFKALNCDKNYLRIQVIFL